MLLIFAAYYLGKRHGRTEFEWEYGLAGSDLKTARRHRKNGNVQFLIWKPGEQGWPNGKWVNFDSSWWKTFISTEDKERDE